MTRSVNEMSQQELILEIRYLLEIVKHEGDSLLGKEALKILAPLSVARTAGAFLH